MVAVPTWLVDVMVVLATAGLVVYRISLGPGAADIEPDAVAYGLGLAMALLLLARRRWPLVVLSGVFLLFVVYHYLRYPGGAPSPALWVALYSAAASERRRTVVLGLVALLILLGDLEARTKLEGVPPLATGLDSSSVVLVAVLLLGEVVHSRRALLRRVEADHELEAQRRVAAERLRIARELHDVLAHTVAVISVQAGVAGDVLERRPDTARSALNAIRTASREAMEELTATIGVLRQPGAGPGPEAGNGRPRAPAPGLAQLGELVARARAGGLRVELTAEGEARALPPAVDLTAFRIVQESLANVLRHAQATMAAVSIRYLPDGVLLEVLDDGRGPAGGAAGYGLVGMHERAAALGGWVTAGAGARGGFLVRARLPTLGGTG